MKIRTKDIPQPVYELLEEAVEEWLRRPSPEGLKEIKRLRELRERGETHDVTF